MIHVDNGSEMISLAFIQWIDKYRVQVSYIYLGKPNQNVYIE